MKAPKKVNCNGWSFFVYTLSVKQYALSKSTINSIRSHLNLISLVTTIEYVN